jgi:ASCH domain
MTRCLSVRQPWAWAIIHGPKRVENRTWPTNHRGRLWIHAGSSRRSFADAEPATWPERYGITCPDPDSLAFGAVIGSVEVVDCVPSVNMEGDPWAIGPWCWVLANPAPLATPAAIAGRLMLFEVPDSVIDVVDG